MIARIIIAGLVALSLSSIPSSYSADSKPAAQVLRTASVHIQQLQSTHPSKSPRIFIEEDFSTAQMLRRELSAWSDRIGVPIIFVEKDIEPYDLRLLLASDVGSGSGSCTPPFAESSSSCSVHITLHFVSAVALDPEGKLLFTETGVGQGKIGAIYPLSRKLAKRLSVPLDTKATPSK
jgi:hypothetical protein